MAKGNSNNKEGVTVPPAALRRLMTEGQPSEEYSATVATAILTEDSYHFVKKELINLILWDDEFQQLENGLQKIAFL